MLGGVLRLVISQHSTYLINSAAHIWGRQPYSNSSTARDNTFLALLTYGEGYHNYHHTFQWDYRNGNRWWHYDPTKWLISFLSIAGITKGLKTCSPAIVETAKLQKQYLDATDKCKLLKISENWQICLEEEYHQFANTLKTWSEHHKVIFESKKLAHKRVQIPNLLNSGNEADNELIRTVVNKKRRKKRKSLKFRSSNNKTKKSI